MPTPPTRTPPMGAMAALMAAVAVEMAAEAVTAAASEAVRAAPAGFRLLRDDTAGDLARAGTAATRPAPAPRRAERRRESPGGART